MFGRGRSGNVALLQELGGELGFAVHALPDVDLDGQPVSSTRIRDAVRAGDFALAGQMLGRPYALVRRRDQGPATRPQDRISNRQPGCRPACLCRPRASMRRRRRVGAGPVIAPPSTSAVVPPSIPPTRKSRSKPTCWILTGDLFGQEMELTFLKKLREEQKFPSPDALRAQIAQDIAQTRNL